MEFGSFLIKYGEIGIKGKNRGYFEDALIGGIRRALRSVDGEFEITRERGRIYVDAVGKFDYAGTVEALGRVFGIVGICPMLQLEDKGFEVLEGQVISYIEEAVPDKNISFKVAARRARKNYPLNSQQINDGLGAAILGAFPQMRVDVHRPDVYLNVEIRNKINIYSTVIEGPGGMPVGTSGRGMLLLSGGIDSPVAGYMMARRGVSIEAVYFHAPPYTSERAKQKVMDLARIVSRYSGSIRLYVVSFTEIQMYIYDRCPHDELTIIMRRYMMRIAQRLAEASGCIGLITGESIAQVASQTAQSMAVINEVCAMPVYRPLVAFDKKDIVEISEKIGTYQTSIQPYEDCCTIFVAKHPVTKPKADRIRRSEQRLKEKIGQMCDEAVSGAEIIDIRP